jgi:hypothetical protein
MPAAGTGLHQHLVAGHGVLAHRHGRLPADPAAARSGDFERVHKTQLSRLPHVAHIQSSFALRDVVRRALPADLLRD